MIRLKQTQYKFLISLILGVLLITGCSKKEDNSEIIIVSPEFSEAKNHKDKIAISFSYYDQSGNSVVLECDFDWAALSKENTKLNGQCPALSPGNYVYRLEYREKGSNLLLASASDAVEIKKDGTIRIVPTLNKHIAPGVNDVDNLTHFLKSIGENQAPTANAGEDKLFSLGTTVTLSGIESSDPEEDALTHTWKLLSAPNESTATLNNSEGETVQIKPDVIGEYSIELIVNDGEFDSAPDTITIQITTEAVANNAPTANAGNEQTVLESTEVTLNGNGFDSDGSVDSFLWTQISGPSVSLANENNATTTFDAPTVDSNTTLIFRLTVTDNASDSTTSDVTINILDKESNNLAPTANAGDDQTIIESLTVDLNGSGSDTDGNIVSFEWKQTSGPSVTLDNPNTAFTSFQAPNVDGDSILIFELTVVDNIGASATDSITVNVTDISPTSPPIINITAISAAINNRITLNGSFLVAESVTIDWGDGTAIQELNAGFDTIDIFHDYSDNALKTIQIIATNEFGETSQSYISLFDITTTNTGVVNFDSTNNVYNTVVNEPFSLTVDNNYASYNWAFSNGTAPVAAASTGDVIFDTTGTFTASLTVTDDKGAQGKTQWTINVSDDVQPDIQIDSPIPDVDGLGNIFHPDGSTEIFQANTIEIWQSESLDFQSTVIATGNTPHTISWNFAGAREDANQEDTGLLDFNLAGEYTVVLTITDADGDIVNKNISLIVKDPNNIDTGAKTDAKTIFAPFPQAMAAKPTHFNIFAQHANPLSEKSTTFQLDNTDLTPAITLFKYQVINLDFSASSKQVLQSMWNLGDGSGDQIIDSLSHKFATTGIYTVKLTTTFLDGTQEIDTVDFTVIEENIDRSIRAPQGDAIHIMVPLESPPIQNVGYKHIIAQHTVQRPDVDVLFPVDGVLDLGIVSIFERQTINFSTPTEASAGVLIYEWNYGGVDNPQGNTLSLNYPTTGEFPLTLKAVLIGGSTEIYTLTVSAKADTSGAETAPKIDYKHIMVPVDPLGITNSVIIDSATTP